MCLSPSRRPDQWGLAGHHRRDGRAESAEQNVPARFLEANRGLAHFAQSSEQNVPVPFEGPKLYLLAPPRNPF
jgi:hypothetical protein